MTIPVLAADPRGLATLKAQAAGGGSDQTKLEVARQFESLFAQMMIKSMRATHFGDDGLGNGGDTYMQMFDQQIAQSMTQGKGLGLAQMLMRQFQHGAAASTDSETSTAASAGSTQNLSGAISAAVKALRALDASDRSASTAPTSSTTGSAADGSSTTTPDKIRSFVAGLLPQAQAVAQKLGVSARVLIAQAALETGWGQHVVGGAGSDGSHNLFGIKATGDAPSTASQTTEYVNGQPVQVAAAFHRYASNSDALQGYAQLIGGNPRYQAVVGSGDDAHRFATALQRAGYATDPNYARKLVAVADSPDMSAAIDAANGSGGV